MSKCLNPRSLLIELSLEGIASKAFSRSHGAARLASDWSV
jgi:hypothetical protein